jgi:ankyrin repeat protein
VNKQTPLITACSGSNYEMVKLLLDAGAEVNKPNILNQTPLVVSVFRLL